MIDRELTAQQSGAAVRLLGVIVLCMRHLAIADRRAARSKVPRAMSHESTEHSQIPDCEELSGAYRQKMHRKYDDPIMCFIDNLRQRHWPISICSVTRNNACALHTFFALTASEMQ